MALQIVIAKEDRSFAESALREVWEEIEVFDMEGHHLGLSIPTKILDSTGEDQIRMYLSHLPHYDLWEGKWKNTEQDGAGQPATRSESK